MKRSLLLALLVMLPISVWAAEGSVPFEFDPNLDNQASLQRGAKLFMNYCSGCHSLQYMRYNRIAEDLEIPRDVVENNLIMTGGKIHSTIQGTMSKEQAGDWFGKAPPDLSLIARQRGADWIYSFLLSFYLDDSRPNGVNNLVMANTAMPHVLAPLQGLLGGVAHPLMAAADQRRARQLAAFANTGYDGGSHLYIELAGRVVVEKKQRFRTHDGNIVTAHGDQIDTNGVVDTQIHCQS